MDPICVALIWIFSTIAIGVFFGFIISILRDKIKISKKARDIQLEETRMVQEIYHGLTKMDKRIDSLEILMMDSIKEKEESWL